MGAAFSHLSAADHEAQLGPEDLVQLAQAAQLIGKESEGAEVLARAHQGFASRGEIHAAVRCAFWLGFIALLGGELAKAGGWLSRANRLLEGHPECVERGYLLLPVAFRSLHSGDPAGAHATFLEATQIGERFGDKDLTTLALQGQGRALIRQGEIARGVTLLDEAMVAVTAGEVSPLNAGGVYCSVLDACGEIFDLQRAQEWTTALEKWCEQQPDLVPYRGHCLIRRAELLQLHGEWPGALEWAQRAAAWLSHPTPRAGAGAAFYQVGEIHRLCGRFAESEEAFREASQWYRGAGLGLARLRLAQGRVEAASAAIRSVMDEVREPGPRARVLEASVEIAVSGKDFATARACAEELAEIAARRDVPFLKALACRSAGAVRLAEGNGREAMTDLRRSWNLWCELQAPYEASRTRMLLALACRELGDEEGARLELVAARETFERLGATFDLSQVDGLLSQREPGTASRLTDRELQVLKLVASGMTNRAIADRLNISEKTIARHLSNIFTKLDLSSRSAATAYAYEHKLV